MTYYIPQDYIEHYVVPFSDSDGNEWKVSIQEPWYEGETVTLVGAAIPVEWMGRGDEDQTEVVLGSTGNLRLVVTEETETYFQKGALLPTYINDRRVQVFMMYGGQWVLFWQGFIVPESFSQDWDAAPREVELPIASVVAAMEYFTMPMKNDVCYAYFAEQTNIAGLLRAIFAWSGCEVLNIVTNKPIYEDFNGQTSGNVPRHWTEGVVSANFFYDNSNGQLRPKTFKDVLETIAYPYGKVQDYAYYVIFAMRWKDDADSSARFQSMAVWHSYQGGTYATGNRFSENVFIPKVSLEEKIITEGTDNKVSIVQPPASVQFSAEPEESTEIFELSEKYIKPSLPIGETLAGLPIEEREIKIDDNSSLLRDLYAIHKNYVNMEFGEDWDFVNEQAEQQANWPFCRVVETKGDDNTKRFTTTTPVKLGFCFNINSTDGAALSAKTSFTIPNGVRSRYGANLIKISVKPYMIEQKDPKAGNSESIFEYNTGLFAQVQDLTAGKWLVRDPDNNKWQWQNTEGETDIIFWAKDNGEWVLWFNEYRDSGDTSLHKLRITIGCVTNKVLSGNTWGRMYCTFKMEYVANDLMDKVNDSTYTIPSSAVLAAFAKGIKTSATVENPGGSDNLRIELKTQIGNRNIIINGSITLPTNSFCDATKYIDMGEREKIEIEAAKSERLYYGYYYWLATQYAIVTDGSKVYIPVAVGMNPRMNSIRLTLVSTNVTSQATS